MSLSGRYWYSYKGPGFDPLAAGSYALIGGNNKPVCPGFTDVCAIYAYSPAKTQSPPALSTNVRSYISLALAGDNNGYPTSGPNYFVYKRD